MSETCPKCGAKTVDRCGDVCDYECGASWYPVTGELAYTEGSEYLHAQLAAANETIKRLLEVGTDLANDECTCDDWFEARRDAESAQNKAPGGGPGAGEP